MNRNTIIGLFALIVITNLAGMIFIDLMDIDAAQYASISREMLENGNFLNVQHRSADYLDKPPLLFWLSSMFYYFFGVSHFVYRLPSMLFTLLGVYSTYKLGCLLYNKRSGIFASLIFYSSQALFSISHDVKTDTILVSTIIFSVWQIYLYLRTKKLTSLILGSAGVGLSMLEKGPIGLMVPVLVLGSFILYTRQFKIIFNFRWILSVAVILLLLSPMLFGLYRQYGINGLRFYFWTQSFGRITGESEWRDTTDSFFFVHTFLWTFAPWMILAIYSTFAKFGIIIKEKLSAEYRSDIIGLAGFLLPFIALSFSRYKLPHYIFVTFPFAALLTGNFLDKLFLNQSSKKKIKAFYFIQVFISIIFISIIPLVLYFVFPSDNFLFLLPILALFFFYVYFAFINNEVENKIFTASILAFVTLNLFMNTIFFPNLLKYQSGSVISDFVNKNGVDLKTVYFFQTKSQAFDFYTKNITIDLDENNIGDTLKTRKAIWLYTRSEGKDLLEKKNLNIVEIKKFDCFHVSMLTINFLNYKTRRDNLTPYYLIKLSL